MSKQYLKKKKYIYIYIYLYFPLPVGSDLIILQQMSNQNLRQQRKKWRTK